jgi:5'-nucleotidase
LAVVAVLVFSFAWFSCTEPDEQSGAANTTATSGGDVASIQILGINDFEGRLEPTVEDGRKVGGAAYLAAYLDKFAREDPAGTIRVHVGDLVGASPLISSYFHDEPTIEATNLMGIDVATVGNHEFDEGGEEMLRLIRGGQRDDGKEVKGGRNTSDPDFEGAKYPYVSANVVYDSGENVLPPYKVLEREGVKVGFIGVTTTAAPQVVVPDAVEPFKFLDISNSVNRYAEELQREGVETIVVLSHAGNENEDIDPPEGEIVAEAKQMSDAVDAIIAGNTEFEIDQDIAGKLVLQASGKGLDFAVADLEVDRQSDDLIDSSGEVVPVYDDQVEPDPEVQALVEESRERIAPIANREIGEAAEDITADANEVGESALGDLIADAQREFADADFAFMNPGGIRADISAGPVTYEDLFMTQPFDNGLTRVEMTGAQIEDLLEQQFELETTTILQISGLKYAYDESNPKGERVTEITLPDGSPLDPSATYTVATNSFLLTGGDGFTVFKEARNAETLGGDLEALVKYVENLPQPFTAPDPGEERRITSEG